MAEQLDIVLFWSLIWILVLEGLTLVGRWGFGLQMREHASMFSKLTLGFRCHHAFPGVLLLGVVPFLPQITWQVHLVAFANGLIFSDLIHHFVVLFPLSGDHEFHLLAEAEPPALVRDEIEELTVQGSLGYGFVWGVLLAGLLFFLQQCVIESPISPTAPLLSSFLFSLPEHHGYGGVGFLLLAVVTKKPFWVNAFSILGIAMTVSDAVLHLCLEPVL